MFMIAAYNREMKQGTHRGVSEATPCGNFSEQHEVQMPNSLDVTTRCVSGA